MEHFKVLLALLTASLALFGCGINLKSNGEACQTNEECLSQLCKNFSGTTGTCVKNVLGQFCDLKKPTHEVCPETDVCISTNDAPPICSIPCNSDNLDFNQCPRSWRCVELSKKGLPGRYCLPLSYISQ